MSASTENTVGLTRLDKSLQRFVGRAYVARAIRGFNEVLAADPILVVARLTLVLLILYSGRFWDIKVPMAIFSALGVVSSRFAKSPYYWTAIASVMALGNIRRIFIVDNHKILMTYWCLAMIPITMTYRREILRTNARVLIGLCFFFATVWKATTTNFMDGSFMQFTLLEDPRFRDFAKLIAGVHDGLIADNREALADVYTYKTNSVELGNTIEASFAGQFMAWYTIVAEGAIAICFMFCTWSRALNRLRNATLMFFLFTTYSVATVIGFGWLLSILGFAQCTRDEPVSKAGYLAAFVTLQLFLVPWANVLPEINVRLWL